MFCYQCQEAAKGEGCTIRGVCGKAPETAGLQDLLIFTLKGVSALSRSLSQEIDDHSRPVARFCARALFATITNANFHNDRIREMIREALSIREELKARGASAEHSAANWNAREAEWENYARAVGIMSEPDEDIRSLKELITYGLKGICAYATHAAVLNHENDEIWAFLLSTLDSLLSEQDMQKLIALTLKTGETAVKTMALLDGANTEHYGNPEITKVNIGVGNRPGILVSGHDLKDFEELLEQTKDSGVDIYTHSEMLPAHYYPRFKKYDHFVGNYGNAWWKQDKEFDSFNGAILMTTNCIVPVRDAYKDRIFTTGVVGYPDIPHIEEVDGKKDFTPLITRALECKAPQEIENGEITGGFAHAQVLSLADKVVDAVKNGDISRFVVMAGCDGRQKGRSYFSDVAETLPDSTVILTAGCAKYRYNKMDLGDIAGIPRVLDAGQCNDSYSLALIALKLKEVFGLDDINELPISYDIAWYEQKAVAVLLALLSLGVKGIRLGPTLPAFLSPNVAKVLVENFNIKPTGEVEEDVQSIMAGN
ncbi:hydroxylamine reductase [Salinispira pacifica]|uniref:Hydroxylamine reductase n=1 Tax=Salinispira pacifica TaxID=1307761 RepID=V5WEF2_9SPIO|nr:hydroxylamine reductase [Salinispira pacifica]AHC13944.1 Hydroxylamine reductase [Salinispira pacifica]